MKILLFSQIFPEIKNSREIEYLRAFDSAEKETSPFYFKQLSKIAGDDSTIFTIYPDMLSMPNTGFASMQKAGKDIRIVQNMEEALLRAKRKRRNRIYFPAFSFYVSAAAMAATLIKARMDGIQNFRICNDLKSEKALLEGLLSRDRTINGVMLLPQTANLFGKNELIRLSAKYEVLFAVSAPEENEFYENLQILSGNISRGENVQYLQASIRDDANPSVNAVIEEVFSLKDAVWENYGLIPGSKFCLNERYKIYDGGNE